MSMTQDGLATLVRGHVLLKEHDLIVVNGESVISEGTTLVDTFNAVHPQNMARLFGRALANEGNSFINTVAFGNGGTQIDVTGSITYNTPRDGLHAGDNEWESRLYHETYRETVDDSNVTIGSGPGSSPSNDPASVEHVSGPGVKSIENLTTGSTVTSVVISATLNPFEPSSQVISQQGGVNGESNTEADFMFDEIGLFTSGAPFGDTPGYQNVDIGAKNSIQDSGLSPSTTYQFSILVDGTNSSIVSFVTPSVGTGDGTNAPSSAITYGDVVTILNVVSGDLDTVGAFASITDSTPTQSGGVETFGYLKFESNTSGSGSSVLVTDISLFVDLSGFVSIQTGIAGEASGIRNDPTNPTTERERMLTHVTFSPVAKSSDRIISLTYTLLLTVAPTQ